MNPSFSNKTIIVGSGSSVLKYPNLGPIIDSFETVIRFNGCQDQLNNYSGLKTNILICNGSEQSLYFLTKTNFNMHNIKLYIYDVSHQKNIKRKEISKQIKNFFISNKLNHMPINLSNFTGNFKTKSRPTTGFKTINYFISLNNTNKLYVHGFNSIDETPIINGKFHFFNSPFKSAYGTLHDLKEEGSILITHYVNKYKIFPLINEIYKS